MDNEAMDGILFFDGACGMCTRSRDFLLKLNRTGALQTEPLQRDGTAERLGIAPEHLMDSVRWLDSSGRVYAGAEAANAALAAALGTRVPLLLYRIPGVRSAQDAVYRWVADHRYRFPGTTPYCESHPVAC
jgi:predicted DCC family thiol-disulfide oxidoreductase YuxK